MNVFKIIRMASLGNPKLFNKMILWTCLEYFLRGVPYGISMVIILEIFKPLQEPETTLNIQTIIYACIGLAVSLIMLYFASKTAYFESFGTGYKITSDGRKKVVEHLQKLPMGFFNSRDPGDIGAYIVHDYKNIEEMVTHMVPQLFGAIFMPLILICALSYYNWQLALTSIVVIPIYIPFVFIASIVVEKLGQKHQQIKIESSSRMLEYIQGIKLIKAFNLTGTKFTRLENAFRRLRNISIKLEAVPGSVMSFSSVILNNGFIIMIILGYNMLTSNKLSLPVYIMFLVMGMRVFQPFLNATRFIVEMNYMKLGVERTNKLLKLPPLTEGKRLTELKSIDIELHNIEFSYHNTKVIDNISLQIPANNIVAFVGPSGSGKTTLTRLIARFWDTDKGKITIGGVNVKDYTSNILMSQIAIVFQDVYLFHDTVYNNIKMGRENATEEEITNAAKQAQCHGFIQSLPEGYNTVIGEGGNTLSGGEKQRISIARAILKEAPIILLDEATASLDPENELYIQRAINDLVKDKTVIMIAHRLHTVKAADKIFVIDNGRILEEGTHKELLTNNGLYCSLWNEQQHAKNWQFTN